MYRILTHSNGTDWCVVTEWYGEQRVVETGTIIECADYVRAREAEDKAAA